MTDLKPVSFIVLGLLEQSGGATPYELKRMAEAFADLWALRHDQVYREPERLAKAGLVSEQREDGGRRRRRFTLTAEGRSALQAWREAPANDSPTLRDPGLLRLLFGADPESVARDQLELHTGKLEAYRELAQTLDQWATPGVRRAINAGIGHEVEWVRFWSDLRAGGDGAL